MQAGALPDLPERRLDFGFETGRLSPGFYAGDPALSDVLVALSLVFPEGERFFVKSVMHFRDRIDDPALLERIAGFAAQEGLHSRAHVAFNAMLDGPEREVARDTERRVKALLDRGRRLRSPEAALAVTCALEHFTAIMAEQLLTHEKLRQSFAPAASGLWLWHALEETEHKSVAFDVYEHVDGSYPRRVGMMLVTTLFFVGFVGHAHARLLGARKQGRDIAGLGRSFAHYWLWPGWFGRLVPGYLRYFAPGFHPDRRDASSLVRHWRERLFGAQGLLTRQLEQA